MTPLENCTSRALSQPSDIGACTQTHCPLAVSKARISVSAPACAAGSNTPDLPLTVTGLPGGGEVASLARRHKAG